MASGDPTPAERARALRDKIRTYILRTITRGAAVVELDTHVMLGILDDFDRMEQSASAVAVENIEAEARHRLAEAAAERRALERAAEHVASMGPRAVRPSMKQIADEIRALAKEPKP